MADVCTAHCKDAAPKIGKKNIPREETALPQSQFLHIHTGTEAAQFDFWEYISMVHIA
jgi:hypothetical protein